MNWIKRLKKKWGVSSKQVVIILLVFTCTGFTVLFLKAPILSLITPEAERNIWFSIVYYILILPVYNIILLFYGFVFGQFQFFLNFEKRMFSRFKKRKEKTT